MLVVAFRVVVAVVRATALGARERRVQDGFRDRAERLRLIQPAAWLVFCGNARDIDRALE